ncbi:MAG: hypothetical protein KAR13_19080 [Desulfobulbaceae bacterium]|nr:hypothetical protein [Desulfobulbaceae bacterium]
MDQDSTYYIITEESFVGLTTDNQLNGNVRLGQYARFNDPAAALEIALKVKKTHAGQLEGSELFIYRVATGNDLQKGPVLMTGIPLRMRGMWNKNIGGEFPEKLLTQ